MSMDLACEASRAAGKRLTGKKRPPPLPLEQLLDGSPVVEPMLLQVMHVPVATIADPFISLASMVASDATSNDPPSTTLWHNPLASEIPDLDASSTMSDLLSSCSPHRSVTWTLPPPVLGRRRWRRWGGSRPVLEGKAKGQEESNVQEPLPAEPLPAEAAAVRKWLVADMGDGAVRLVGY